MKLLLQLMLFKAIVLPLVSFGVAEYFISMQQTMLLPFSIIKSISD